MIDISFRFFSVGRHIRIPAGTNAHIVRRLIRSSALTCSFFRFDKITHQVTEARAHWETALASMYSKNSRRASEGAWIGRGGRGACTLASSFNMSRGSVIFCGLCVAKRRVYFHLCLLCSARRCGGVDNTVFVHRRDRLTYLGLPRYIDWSTNRT